MVCLEPYNSQDGVSRSQLFRRQVLLLLGPLVTPFIARWWWIEFGSLVPGADVTHVPQVQEVVKKAKTLNCVLCRGLVAYTKENRERFNSHMAILHGISENMNYILAGCLMNQDERDVVADIIKEREGTGRGKEREGTSQGPTHGEEVTEDDDIEAKIWNVRSVARSSRRGGVCGFTGEVTTGR